MFEHLNEHADRVGQSNESADAVPPVSLKDEKDEELKESMVRGVANFPLILTRRQNNKTKKVDW